MPDETLTIPPLMLGGSLWAIRPELLPRLAQAHRLSDATDLARFVADHAAASARDRVATRRSGTERAGGAVAVIPLTGILTPRPSFLSFLFGGGYGLIDFREMFRDAVASPDIGAIVIDVDSPGGLLDLIPETAAEVFEARGSKPIVAVVNTLACSAAYWIASQADELVSTPSGNAGSIGVYRIHEDWSGANEQMGIDPTYVYAGKHKTEGNPDEPLSDDARADWQMHVDLVYGDFTAAVAQGRGVSVDSLRAADYGQGRVLYAPQALEAGLIDRIDTIETVIADLLVPAGGSGGGTSGRARIIAPPSARGEDPAAPASTTPAPETPSEADVPPAAEVEPAELADESPPPDDEHDDDAHHELSDDERAAIADIQLA